MWKPLVIAGTVVTAVLFAATPLLALKRLRSGLESRDPAIVKPLVDFPTLRANIKASTNEKIEKQNDGKLLEPVRNWIGKQIADDVLDRVATPEGLIRLTCDKQTDADLSKGQGKPCTLGGKTRHFGYKSFNLFRIDVTQSDGQDVSLVLSRHGLTDWRLVNVLGTGAGS